MKKDELRNGMFVEFEDGCRSIVFRNNIEDVLLFFGRAAVKGGYQSMNLLSDDLILTFPANEEFKSKEVSCPIVKVYQSQDVGILIYAIDKATDNDEHYKLTNRDNKLLWSREETTKH